MTGPGHYREAERDIQLADKSFENSPGEAQLYYHSAQVHATLAVAAAIAATGFHERSADIAEEWEALIAPDGGAS